MIGQIHTMDLSDQPIFHGMEKDLFGDIFISNKYNTESMLEILCLFLKNAKVSQF